MRYIIIKICCLLSLSSFGQFDKTISLRASGNFNVTRNGFGTNDAGLGLGLDASFFSNHKLNLLTETSAETFFGSKEFIINPEGRENKAPVIYSVKAGPQFFISKNIALSVTYGPSWYSIQAVSFTSDYGFKLGITGLFGKERRLVTKVFLAEIPKDNINIQYFGVGVGYRFY